MGLLRKRCSWHLAYALRRAIPQDAERILEENIADHLVPTSRGSCSLSFRHSWPPWRCTASLSRVCSNSRNHETDSNYSGHKHHQAPPRRPAVDPVVGGFPRVRDPAPASRCFQAETVPDVPLYARSGREAFLQARDTEAETDHGPDPLRGRVGTNLLPGIFAGHHRSSTSLGPRLTVGTDGMAVNPRRTRP